MSGINKAVFGIYDSRAEVERAVDALKEDGFYADDISVLLPDNKGSQEFAHTKNTKAPEGAATGASTGVVIGGALGWLVGIGALAIPGVGPLIAAGPIVSALAGAGIGGTFGGISGALIGLGIPEYEAKRYEGIVKDGGILLSVHVDTSILADMAKETLEVTGARDIASTSEVRSAEADLSIRQKERDIHSPTSDIY
jgi:hypothetical protein